MDTVGARRWRSRGQSARLRRAINSTVVEWPRTSSLPGRPPESSDEVREAAIGIRPTTDRTVQFPGGMPRVPYHFPHRGSMVDEGVTTPFIVRGAVVRGAQFAEAVSHVRHGPARMRRCTSRSSRPAPPLHSRSHAPHRPVRGSEAQPAARGKSGRLTGEYSGTDGPARWSRKPRVARLIH